MYIYIAYDYIREILDLYIYNLSMYTKLHVYIYFNILYTAFEWLPLVISQLAHLRIFPKTSI